MRAPEERRKLALEIAQNLLSQQISAVEAVRALVPIIRVDSTLVSREDRKAMLGYEKEIEDLPVGRVREVWHPDALLEKDKEIEKHERLYGAEVKAVCERLVKKWAALAK